MKELNKATIEMKSTDILSALIHFFNDLVAHIIPGLLLVVSAAYILGEFSNMGFKEIPWPIHIALYYTLGHLLLAFNAYISEKNWLSKLKFQKTSTPEIKNSDTAKLFQDLIKKKGGFDDVDKLSINNLRSIAMSIDSEARDLGQRFMFISLFCKGVATAALSISTLNLLITLFTKINQLESIYYYLTSLGLLFIVYLFNKRAISFEARAFQVAFPVAIAKFRLEKGSDEN
jgi:hypothetical protein